MEKSSTKVLQTFYFHPLNNHYMEVLLRILQDNRKN